MLRKQQISLRQFSILVIIFTVGEGIFLLPGIVTNEAKQDGWIASLISLLMGILFVLFYEQFARLYPKLTLVEISEKVLGSWLGKGFALLFIGYAFYYAAVALREIGDFLTTQNYPETPMIFIHILVVIVVVMAVRLGIEPIARSVEIFLPWLAVLLLFLILCSIPKMDVYHIQPVFSEEFRSIVRASIPFTAYSFVELAFFLMIVPYVKERQHLRKSWLWGSMIGSAVITIVTIVAILVLGAELTARQMYPGYNLAKLIYIGDFLQRVEASLAVIWFITIFVRVTIYFFVTVTGLAQVFRLQNHKSIATPLGVILVALASIVSTDIVYFNHLNQYWPFLDLFFGFLFVLFLWIVHLGKKLFRLN